MILGDRNKENSENDEPIRWKTIPTYYKVITTPRVYEDASMQLQVKPEPYLYFKISFGDIEKYSVAKFIGSGRFSAVFKGFYEGGECAIKVFRPVQMLYIKRELYFLYRVRECPNVIKFIDLVQDPLTNSVAHIAEYVHYRGARQLYPTFTIDDVRYYIYNLMKTLDEVHSRGIMHRDVKPDNLLIDHAQRKIRLLDWGLAEVYFPKQQYPPYVGTLRYKAPELLLGYRYYDYSVDIWAAGITMGEMMCRYPFFEGEFPDEIIREMCRLVTGSAILVAADKYGIDVCDAFLHAMPSYNFFGWDRLLEATREDMKDLEAFDLLKRFLCVDHVNRITAKEALQHPFLSPLSKTTTESLTMS